MRLDVHHYHHSVDNQIGPLDKLLRANIREVDSLDKLLKANIQLQNLIVSLSRSIKQMEERMSEQLTNLVAEVHANTSHTQSLISLVNGLAAKIEDLKDDPVALQSLADEIRATNEAIVASVAANTSLADDLADDPADEEPSPEPSPVSEG